MTVYVIRNAVAFTGINVEQIVPPPDALAALLCVDPPEYDSFTQVFYWNLTWDFEWCV